MLSKAVEAENFDQTQFYLNLGCDPLQNDSCGKIPLLCAVNTDNPALVRLLLSYCNKPLGEKGSEALLLATKNSQNEVVSWLLRYGTSQ